MKHCEDNLKSYVINLDKEKYADLDWISENRPDYKLEKERFWIDEATKFLRKNGIELA